MWEQNLQLYDQLVDLCPRFERKGKTMPYTSANGYMFSLLNKAGEFGIRLPKESGTKFKEKYNSTIFKSHGAIIKDYVLIPNSMFQDLDQLAIYLNEGFDYVMSLKAK